MTSDSILVRVLAWLRAGYPEGIPAHDYVPLMDVLRRRLTPGEVDRAAQLIVDADLVNATTDQIREAVARVALEQPSDEDMRRVASHLALGGWPLSPVEFEGFSGDRTAERRN